MTDTTPTSNVEEVPPDVETCLEQLRDPAVLLAEALHRVHRADQAYAAADRQGHETERHHLHREHLTRTAETLTMIASTAADMAAQERQAMPSPLRFDEADLEDRTVPPDDLTRVYEPQAVNGVRFTADITCRYIGRVADGLWAYASGVGFLCVSGAAAIEAVAVGVTFDVRFTGRVVSVTPDQALCVTDGGTSVTLPRALIVESPDE